MARFRRIGLELTFLPSKHNPRVINGSYYLSFDALDLILNRAYHLMHKVMERPVHAELNRKLHRISTDPHVVEISTKPLNTKSEVMEVVAKVRKLAMETRQLTTSANWSTGGGCHIHADQFSDVRLSAAVIYDMAHRPSVAYAFNHPCQNHSTKTPLGDIYFNGYNITDDVIPSMNCYKSVSLGDGLLLSTYKWGSNPHSTTKEASVALRDYGDVGTIEFRFFRMPDSLKEHEEHIDFVQAYLKKIEAVGVDGILRIHGTKLPTPPKNIPLKDAIKAFKETIEWVGLPWNRYSKYVKNIEQRYAYHELRIPHPNILANGPVKFLT